MWLSSLGVNGRANPRNTHTPSDRSKLHTSIHLPNPLSTHILNTRLGAHRPIQPLDMANCHGLHSDLPLLDASLKVRPRADSGNYASDSIY